MTWNFRVFRHQEKNGNEYFAIHEAFYDDDEEIPNSWTEKPIELVAEDLNGLKWQLENIALVFNKPILDYDIDNDVSAD